MKRFRPRPRLSLTALALAALGHLAAPAFPGFTLLPLAAGLILAFLAGGEQWRAWGRSLASPYGRTKLTCAAVFLTALGLALAAGTVTGLPSFDFSPDQRRTLAPETLKLLAGLNQPVEITVHIGPPSPRFNSVRTLMERYVQAAGGHLRVNYLNPQTEAAAAPGGPRLVAPDTAQIAAENFRENIAPISENTLNGSLGRLLHPERRLVYFLQTGGEKMVQDQGPGGLSQWAGDLGDRRLIALDYRWPDGRPLPPEASAVILAGPRAPLGEFRENMLLMYLQNGGRALIMADPLTGALSPAFWRAWGLAQPEGLVADPEMNLAGTGEGFVVSQDYPAHPLTRGLANPTVWPLAGAFVAADPAPEDLAATTMALAMSSPSSWLESDAASWAEAAVRFQPEEDLPGPLALGLAAEIEGGGRLVALADSDLAANGFRGWAGNRQLTSQAVNWLLDGEESAWAPAAAPAQTLLLNPISARLIFWGPTLIWPLSVLAVWSIFYRRRRAWRSAGDQD